MPVVSAALGYLAGGLAVLFGWLAWLRRGRAISDDFAADLVRKASDAPRWLGCTWGPWSSDRMRSAQEQERAGFWMWLPLVLFLPILAAVLLASAIVRASG